MWVLFWINENLIFSVQKGVKLWKFWTFLSRVRATSCHKCFVEWEIIVICKKRNTFRSGPSSHSVRPTIAVVCKFRIMMNVLTIIWKLCIVILSDMKVLIIEKTLLCHRLKKKKFALYKLEIVLMANHTMICSCHSKRQEKEIFY